MHSDAFLLTPSFTISLKCFLDNTPAFSKINPGWKPVFGPFLKKNFFFTNFYKKCYCAIFLQHFMLEYVETCHVFVLNRVDRRNNVDNQKEFVTTNIKTWLWSISWPRLAHTASFKNDTNRESKNLELRNTWNNVRLFPLLDKIFRQGWPWHYNRPYIVCIEFYVHIQ